MSKAATGAAITAEDETIIKNRFLYQSTVPRGEPPFKKLLKRFMALVEEVEKGTDDTISKAHEAFLREVTMLELQAEKYKAVNAANQREQLGYQQRKQELQEQIEQARRDIEAKKQELEQAKIIRQQNEEYEVLRHILVQQPARSVTQAEINKVKAEMDKITGEGKRTAAIMQKRRQQFALLFHVIEELQRTIEDVGDDGPDQHPSNAMDVDM